MNNKEINIAIIGCGNIAKRHVEGVLAKEGCVLYAICDNATDSRMQDMKEKYGVQVAVEDYRELVNDPKVDVAIITTPDNTHMEMSIAFLKAGKDVLLEKPMALTLPECEAMLKAEKETGRRLMVGQVCRYTPAFVKAKKMIDEGAIGELVFVESEYAHDYINSRGYNDWRVSPEREGMIGGGCHAVDLLRWIAGDPINVHAFSNHKYLTDWPVNDSTIAIYNFPNNVIGKVFCSIGVKRNYTMRTCIYGTKGTLIFRSYSNQMQLFQCDEEGKGYTKAQILDVEIKGHNMEAEISDFIDAIRSGKPNPISAMEGASTIAVCRATVESAKTGETVQIKYPEV